MKTNASGAKSGIKIKGIFHLKTFKGGKLIDTYTDKNLVVDLGFSTLCNLLAAGDPDNSLTKIKFGTDDTAPSAGDTDLSGPPYEKALDSFNFPTTKKVQFVFSLDETENNGMLIKEFGLFTEAGVLFCRKIHGGIFKDPDIRLDGTWTFIFN